MAAGIALGQIPAAAAEQGNTVVKYGEYADYHLAELKDVDACGPIYYPDTELMYDFDSASVPQSVESVNSTIESSRKYYIALSEENIPTSYSLKWTTEGSGSSLILRPNGFQPANAGYWGTGNVYQHSAAFFQESLPQDGSIRKIQYTLTASKEGKPTERFTYDIDLYDEGWNFFTQQIDRTTLIRDYTVDSIELKQVEGPPGELYVENVMLARGVGVKGMMDPYVGAVITKDEVEQMYPAHDLTEEETASFRKLEQAVLPDMAPVAKLSDSEMKGYEEKYRSWYVELIDGANGKFANGVFPTYYQGTVPGTANSDGYGGTSHPVSKRAGEFSSVFSNLGKAYNKVQNETQKEKLAEYITGLARLALSYENVPEAWYSGAGFSDGCYYGRKALEQAGLLDAIYERLKKQYGLDKLLYREHVWGTESAAEMKASADDFINNAKSNMVILLMAPDGPKKARDLYRFKSFLDNVMYQYSPGTTGTLKPDGTLFHHDVNKYDYGWRDAWNNGLTQYPLWFKDTVFQLEPETLERLDLISEVRYQNIDKTGLGGTPDQVSTMGHNPTLRLAQTGISDGSMGINPYRAAEWLYYGGADNAQKNQFLKMGILPAPSPRTNLTMSYGPINVHRRGEWRVQTYASNDLTSFNEYVRPAFLFYNLGGIALTVSGECPAMQNDARQSIDGRHGFDLASGYNVNRAPGVTAPEVDPKLCEQPAKMKGSSPFAGGVSTKNGSGVFTSQYDLKTAISPDGLKNTGLTDFKFKKSYFYFDNLIVCLGSDIQAAGMDNSPVTTGIFQEKMTDSDVVVTSSGSLGAAGYSSSYRSEEQPWLIDNQKNAGYYLFPGQSYTLSRGEQTFLYKDAASDFDGKGNFVSAYLNHDADRVKAGTETYAYMFLPEADKEKMERLNDSMRSSVPEAEILRQDSQLHAVRNNALDMTGYVFFDSGAVLENDTVRKVSSPVTLMTKEYEGGRGLSLAVADPDLRIRNSEDGYSMAEDVTVTLRGKWQVKDSAEYTARETAVPAVVYTADGDTLFTVSCQDGLTNEYLLEKMETPLSAAAEQVLSFRLDSNTMEVNGAQKALIHPIQVKENVPFLSLTDLAEILPAALRRNTAEDRMECYYRNQKIIFTPDSRVVTTDSRVAVLEKEVFIQNGEFFIPLSALKDVFCFGQDEAKDTLSYTRNHALWYEWDSADVIPEGVVLSGGESGIVPQAGVNTLTLPDDWKEGMFVFAVYKDNALAGVRTLDLSMGHTDRVLQYEIAEGDDPQSYLFKGFVFESMSSLRPVLIHGLVYGNTEKEEKSE